MNVTNHAYKRYCERILKLPKDEVDTYVYKNRDILTKDINTLFSTSKCLWEGIITKEYSKYYIIDNIIIVVNKEDQAIITFLIIDFGFCINDLNINIIKTVTAKVEDLNICLKTTEENIKDEINKKQNEIFNLDSQINVLQEQMNCLQKKKNILTDEVKYTNSLVDPIKAEIKKYASKIIYSLDYRIDFEKDARNIKVN
jgi:CHAT domain-containing protein